MSAQLTHEVGPNLAIRTPCLGLRTAILHGLPQGAKPRHHLLCSFHFRLGLPLTLGRAMSQPRSFPWRNVERTKAAGILAGGKVPGRAEPCHIGMPHASQGVVPQSKSQRKGRSLFSANQDDYGALGRRTETTLFGVSPLGTVWERVGPFALPPSHGTGPWGNVSICPRSSGRRQLWCHIPRQTHSSPTVRLFLTNCHLAFLGHTSVKIYSWWQVMGGQPKVDKSTNK